MVPGQVKTDEKSNKITPIPALLDLLALEGAIINIDAMDCRQQIAEKIIDHKADYVLAVRRTSPIYLMIIKKPLNKQLSLPTI